MALMTTGKKIVHTVALQDVPEVASRKHAAFSSCRKQSIR
jgi:hypothetical protein